jgi:hypothetical protein
LGFSAITIKKKTGPVAVADKLVKNPDWNGLLSSNEQYVDDDAGVLCNAHN